MNIVKRVVKVSFETLKSYSLNRLVTMRVWIQHEHSFLPKLGQFWFHTTHFCISFFLRGLKLAEPSCRNVMPDYSLITLECF